MQKNIEKTKSIFSVAVKPRIYLFEDKKSKLFVPVRYKLLKIQTQFTKIYYHFF